MTRQHISIVHFYKFIFILFFYLSCKTNITVSWLVTGFERPDATQGQFKTTSCGQKLTFKVTTAEGSVLRQHHAKETDVELEE